MSKTLPAVDSIDEIADEIEALSEGIAKLLSGRLTERALVTLIHDAMPSSTYGGKFASRAQIKVVLNAAANLKEMYVKKVKSKENSDDN